MVHAQIRLDHHLQPNVNHHPQNSARRESKTIAEKLILTEANDSDCDSKSDKSKNNDHLILSILWKHENKTEHHINWKDFHVAWRR
jgi:hypothetical protein